jgi:hypothetical protein
MQSNRSPKHYVVSSHIELRQPLLHAAKSSAGSDIFTSTNSADHSERIETRTRDSSRSIAGASGIPCALLQNEVFGAECSPALFFPALEIPDWDNTYNGLSDWNYYIKKNF